MAESRGDQKDVEGNVCLLVHLLCKILWDGGKKRLESNKGGLKYNNNIYCISAPDKMSRCFHAFSYMD